MSSYISVIVPCFNQARFLPDAIESLLDQTYTEWECIIVNDGSTDNTEEIARNLSRLDERIRVITQENKGLSAARNTGVHNAKGEFFQFLDADDKIEKSKFTNQIDYLKSHPEVDIVYGDARYFTNENPDLREYGFLEHRMTSSWIVNLWNEPGIFFEKLLIRCLFAVNCPLIKRSVFDSVGLWNENLEALEDWEFWLRCAVIGINFKFNDPPDTLALIRMHSVSMSRDTDRMQKSSIQMRIAIGKMLKIPSHRLINFREGLKVINTNNPPNKYKHLNSLAIANICQPVLLNYLAFLIKSNLYSK